jgi:2-hydroxy-3-oxopropionate reductase
MSKVGFIGLGIMGTPMARNLQRAGHALFLHSRSGVKDRALLEGGASECASPRAVAAAAEIIIVMVPDTPDVERALFGTDGVAGGLTSGKIVVDMSSISPLATKEFARRIREECAKAGSLTIMVGGEAEVFERVRPLFEVMGKNITLVGGNGDGQTCKVANQIIVALTIEAIGEALVLAARAGADPAKVREALMGGFASSRVLEVHGERMIKRMFNPGFRVEKREVLWSGPPFVSPTGVVRKGKFIYVADPTAGNRITRPTRPSVCRIARFRPGYTRWRPTDHPAGRSAIRPYDRYLSSYTRGVYYHRHRFRSNRRDK